MSVISTLLALIMAPLLPGIISRTKAFVAGRNGPPLLQAYYDLAKLLQKGAVYSQTSTWIFRAGPVVSLAAILTAITLVPLGSCGSLAAFTGDLILFVCLMGLARFFTILAAWDTGSSFEGMGASREAQFAALAEAPLLLALAVLATQLSSLSLGEIYAGISFLDWVQSGPALALTSAALFIVLLAENSRIPVDDPNTHLELTMIHEVMVLDHGGPDLAFILYGSALKLWCFAALLAGLVFPGSGVYGWLDLLTGITAIFGVAILVGLVESIMARLRLLAMPQLLVGAGALAAVALILLTR